MARVRQATVWHPGLTCRQHWMHRIDCATLARLLERAAGGCEICRMPWIAKPRIDHDHRSGDLRFVRGLLCHRCNMDLGPIDQDGAVDEWARAYLDNAWYLTDGLTFYRERAHIWLSEGRAAEDAAFRERHNASDLPAWYVQRQDQIEAWCRTFLSRIQR